MNIKTLTVNHHKMHCQSIAVMTFDFPTSPLFETSKRYLIPFLDYHFSDVVLWILPLSWTTHHKQLFKVFFDYSESSSDFFPGSTVVTIRCDFSVFRAALHLVYFSTSTLLCVNTFSDPSTIRLQSFLQLFCIDLLLSDLHLFGSSISHPSTLWFRYFPSTFLHNHL